MEEVGQGIVRILRSGKRTPIGQGFVVADRHIITAAHVVNAALGRHERATEQPAAGTELDLDFPLLGGIHPPTSRAVLRAWMVPGHEAFDGADVAVLELLDDLPLGARILKLEIRHHAALVKMFGPTPQRPNGGYAEGRLMGTVMGGRVQLNQTSDGVFRAQRGWSGGPVWDVKSGVVVGMLVAAASDETTAVDAYALPAATLSEAWAQRLAPLLIPPNPYMGLRPFDETDERRFFGRTADIDRVLENLEQHGAVTIYGPSGAGKSSLVHAGVLPHLRGWRVASCRPGDKPMRSLAAAVAHAVADHTEVDRAEVGRWQSRLYRSGLSAIADSQGTDVRGLVLVIDQFEEALSTTRERQETLFDLLSTALEHRRAGRLRLLLTVRADGWGKMVTERRRFGSLVEKTGFPLRPLAPDELRSAITEPAAAEGVTFEPRLVERLVSDLEGRPGPLPLLSVALERLWAHQNDRLISVAAYDDEGTVREAVAREAEDVYERLTPAEQKASRRVLTALVTPGQEATRRRARRDEIRDEDWPVARWLVEARLLVADRTATGVETIEPAHEALIREWGRVRGWVAEDQVFLEWLDRTRRRREDWERASRAHGFLDGPFLREALAQLEARPEDVTEALRVFIEASKLEEAERDARYLREATEKVSRQRTDALSLASRSVGLMESDPPRALELALESLASSSTPQGDAAARRAMNRLHAVALEVTHDGPVNAIAFSPDGRSLASASSDGTVRVVDLTSGEEVRIGPPGERLSVAFSPDGSLLASGSRSGRTQVVDVRSRSEVFHHDLSVAVDSLTFSSGGTRLAAIGRDRTAHIYDTVTGDEQMTLGDVHALAFSPDDSLLIGTAHSEGIVRITDASANSRVLAVRHESAPCAIGFTRRSGSSQWLLATASETPDEVTLATYESGEPVTRAIYGKVVTVGVPVENIVTASFSPHGNSLVTATGDGTVRVFTVPGRQVMELAFHDEVAAIAFSANDNVAIASSVGQVGVVDPSRGRLVTTLVLPDTVGHLAFDPDGRLLAATDATGRVSVLEVAPITADLVRMNFSNDVLAVAFLDNGRLVTVDGDGSAITHDLQTGQADVHVRFDIANSLRPEPALSPDGSCLAVRRGQDLVVVDMRTGEVTSELTGIGKVTNLAWDSGLTRIAYAVENGIVGVLDLESGDSQALATFEGGVRDLAFSPDGSRIVVQQAGSRRAGLLDPETGEFLWRSESSIDHPPVFAHSSKHLAVVSDGELVYIRAATGEVAGRRRDVGGSALEFSPDGIHMADGGQHGRVQVFDIGTSATRFTITHDAAVRAVKFSPDGNHLVTAGDDGSVQVAHIRHGAVEAEIVSSGKQSSQSWSSRKPVDVGFSPDGRLVAMSYGKTVRVTVHQSEDLIQLCRERVTCRPREEPNPPSHSVDLRSPSSELTETQLLLLVSLVIVVIVVIAWAALAS